ncbi:MULTISPECIES: hypothetical protein [unclassified Paracoccus (in: a-proteobacteria)]|uniref:hypothetical protein n=1 Tax=unclassified Paracoccus (in: a-proteobacteria) TaxID=2688777 RepID=UPI001ADBB71D|nr:MULTISPECIES: hypothetical protein [unclassified Paracoccus (in: a-proteobacteria)]MBO9457084.1 hypothetical protein [Paracoccus sp. R12_2]
MKYFIVELRFGENKQHWIACCENEADAESLAKEANGSLPNARSEVKALEGDPPFLLKPDNVRQWR